MTDNPTPTPAPLTAAERAGLRAWLGEHAVPVIRTERALVHALLATVDAAEQRATDERAARERVTQSENMQHAVRSGLHSTGERHYAARLTAVDVAETRRLAGQVPQRELARRFGVSRSAIVHILSGKNWKGV